VVPLRLGPDDHSQGYSLSPDPTLHAIELSMHDYSLAHEEMLRQVLASSGDANHRAIAAVFMGYARRSPQQSDVLIAAVRDPNETVRNNAARALVVLVTGVGLAPPTAIFVRMLSSGIWTDRNKSLGILRPLVERGDAELLRELRSRALDALTEMSQWQCPDHSADARSMLSRLSPHSPH
jgi:HEAT repeat protein